MSQKIATQIDIPPKIVEIIPNSPKSKIHNFDPKNSVAYEAGKSEYSRAPWGPAMGRQRDSLSDEGTRGGSTRGGIARPCKWGSGSLPGENFKIFYACKIMTCTPIYII